MTTHPQDRDKAFKPQNATRTSRHTNKLPWQTPAMKSCPIYDTSSGKLVLQTTEGTDGNGRSAGPAS